MGDALYTTGKVYVVRFLDGRYYSGYKGITPNMNQAKLFVDLNEAHKVAQKFNEPYRIYEGTLRLFRIVADNKRGIVPEH